MILWLQLFWLLDELFAPGWRQTKIRGPIFIIGHQRSGSTVLHRLLSSNKSSVGLTLQEMIFPAVTLQWLISRVTSWTQRHARRVSTYLNSIEENAFSELDSVHRMRLGEIEEDEFVMWSIFSSAMCANDDPLTSTHEKLIQLRSFHSWPAKRKTRALNWYRACVQKKIYREFGVSGGWAVAKNPAFTSKIAEISALFPEARFVLLVRNPLEAIPSRLSLIESIWKHRFPAYAGMTSEQVEEIYSDSIKTYLAAESDLEAIPATRKIIVDYSKLAADPIETATHILDYFHINGGINTASVRTHNTRHQYSLEGFSLSKDRITKDLSAVFNRYSFTTCDLEQ